MAYNYSHWYLLDNEEAVRWLVELARTGEVGQKVFTDPSRARRWRENILALMACLSYNQPDMGWVKNRLRTWIDRAKDGAIIVNVGPPDKAGRKLRGPHNRVVEVGVSSAQVLEIQEIKGRQELGQLAALLTGLEEQREAIVRIPPPPQGIEWIRNMVNEVAGLKFEILSVEPHLRLRIIPTSASIALERES